MQPDDKVEEITYIYELFYSIRKFHQKFYRVSQKKCGLSLFLSFWPWEGCF